VREGKRQASSSFFEKKNQKTFAYKELVLLATPTPSCKSFCFFFQKEALPCFDGSASTR
jgi:hypothetical protein